MNRRSLILGAGAIAVNIGAAWLLLSPSSPFNVATISWHGPRPGGAICQENFERLYEGMTLSQVEAILGGPERSETREDGRISVKLPRVKGERHEWSSDEGIILTGFEDGRLRKRYFVTWQRHPSESPRNMMLRWFRWYLRSDE